MTTQLTEAFVPHLGRTVKFQDRTNAPQPFVGRAARLPMRDWQPPVTPLPVESTGEARVHCPMLSNDHLGICGPAMLAHRYQMVKFRNGKGKQVDIDLAALERQYFQVSGGDNGTTEPQAIAILRAGVAGTSDDKFVDALDVDLTDVALIRFLIDQFSTVQMGWSVPSAFHNGFAPGSVWPSAMRPNPRLGHYMPLADVAGKDTPIPDAVDPTGGGRAPFGAGWEQGVATATVTSLEGFYRLWTWGAWCWVSPAFVQSVRPDGFVVFSLGMFDEQGLDARGRHITTQAALWVKCGGKPIPAAILAQYPPASPVDQPDWSTWV